MPPNESEQRYRTLADQQQRLAQIHGDAARIVLGVLFTEFNRQAQFGMEPSLEDLAYAIVDVTPRPTSMQLTMEALKEQNVTHDVVHVV